MPRLTHHARRELVKERQQQILHAAAEVFSEKGFAGATIRDVARAAGVSEGSIYLYFKNKQDLLVHLPRQFMQPRLEQFQSAFLNADVPPSPEELLRFIAQSVMQVVTQNRELVRVLFTSLPTMDEETRETYIREVPAYAMETLEAYIRAQQEAGVFRAEIDPQISARVLPGMMLFFLMIQEIVQPRNLPHFEYDLIIQNVVEIFLHGMMNASAETATSPQASPSENTSPRKPPKHAVEIE